MFTQQIYIELFLCAGHWGYSCGPDLSPILVSKLVIEPWKFPGICQPVILCNSDQSPSALDVFIWYLGRMQGERTESPVPSFPCPSFLEPHYLPAGLPARQAWSFPRISALAHPPACNIQAQMSRELIPALPLPCFRFLLKRYLFREVLPVQPLDNV